MNVADSQRTASALEHLGYQAVTRPDEADVIVLNTCVVRQSAEDKAYGWLTSLLPLKRKKPELVINLMGCLVGTRTPEALIKRFPYVDVFSPPSDPEPLVEFLQRREGRMVELEDIQARFERMDEELILPVDARGKQVIGFVPVVLGCSHACTYCIIPLRRGGEQSRPPEDILNDVHSLVNQGVREITLLGQIVDRYGLDQPGYPTLAEILRRLHQIEGLERIRFLTSHPNWMTEELLNAVVELPKVMPHIEVPVQAGDDEVLAAMKRGYTVQQYRDLIARLRERIPGVSIGTDVIVGFPGETAEQFENTYRLLADLKMDVAHLARYSPRPGTVSERRMEDNVPGDEKMLRFRRLERLQEQVVSEIHARMLGTRQSILFEEMKGMRWKGRTPTNKLVFVDSNEDLHGQIRTVEIIRTGAWSMTGKLIDE